MHFARSIILAVAAMALSLAACGPKSQDAAQAPAADSPAVSEAPAAESAPVEPAPAAPAAEPASDDMGPRAIAFMEAMAKAAADHEGDCDAQAAALQQLVDDNQQLLADMKEFDKDEVKKRELEEQYGQQAMTIMQGMMGSLQACGEHEGVRKVFESFE